MNVGLYFEITSGFCLFQCELERERGDGSRKTRLHSDSSGPQTVRRKQKKAGEEGAIGGGISQQSQGESKSHGAEDVGRAMS